MDAVEEEAGASEVAEEVVGSEVEAVESVGPVAAFPVDRVPRSAALRRSVVLRHGHRLRRGHPHLPPVLRFRALVPASAEALGPVAETSEAVARVLAPEWEIVRASEQVVRLVIVLHNCRALVQVPASVRDRGSVPAQELEIDRARDRGSPIGPASHSFPRIACQDSVQPPALERSEAGLEIVCRIKERGFKTAWPIGRRRVIAETT